MRETTINKEEDAFIYLIQWLRNPPPSVGYVTYGYEVYLPVENNIVLGQAREDLRREFREFTVLLKYWRDEAAHGRASHISDNEAFTSLAYLLRFAQFADAHWDELTREAS
jgi:hypothetical protein